MNDAPALVVQPGVDGRRGDRAWVQIPSRALAARYANRQSGEAQTFATLWVRLPPLPLHNETCSPRLAVNQLSRNKRGGDEEVRFLHVSLVEKDLMPRWSIGMTPGSQPGTARFDSGTGCSWPSGGIGRHTTLRTSCRKAWEFESPLGHLIASEITAALLAPGSARGSRRVSQDDVNRNGNTPPGEPGARSKTR